MVIFHSYVSLPEGNPPVGAVEIEQTMMNHWKRTMLVVLGPLSSAKVSHLLSVAHPGEPEIGTETHELGWPSFLGAGWHGCST